MTEKSKTAIAWLMALTSFLAIGAVASHQSPSRPPARPSQNQLAVSEANESTDPEPKEEKIADGTPEQKAADESVVVAACDTLLDKGLISAKGASKAWSWDYSFGKNNTLIVERDFSSENAFGAKIKSRYHCEGDAATHRITKLIVSGPFGDQRVL